MLWFEVIPIVWFHVENFRWYFVCSSCLLYVVSLLSSQKHWPVLLAYRSPVGTEGLPFGSTLFPSMCTTHSSWNNSSWNKIFWVFVWVWVCFVLFVLNRRTLKECEFIFRCDEPLNYLCQISMLIQLDF